jgi:two-component system cell cycle sensor histidine kinase/response regulator CckA
MKELTNRECSKNSDIHQEQIHTLQYGLGALRQPERNHRVLLEQGPAGVVVARDNPFRPVYVNQAMAELTGRTTEEFLSSTQSDILDWVHEQDRVEFLQWFQGRLRGSTSPRLFEFRTIRKEGTILWLIVSTRCVEYEGKPSVLAMFMDITERKLMEERAGKLEGRLRQAQKIVAIWTLAGGIANDFNNLLMGIQGYASLLLVDMSPGQPHYEKLRSIEEQVLKGAELTRQLLGFARGGLYEVKPLNINEVVRKSSAMFGRSKKELTIHRRLKQSLWAVEADRGQIEKVLMTLFVNAWQAMPGGGELTIETGNTEIGEDHSLPYQVYPGRYVRVAVSDTGMGMDEQTQQRVFDPFFTTKAMGRGTGLGLATVYGIVKGHGGFIQVESAPGQGATFTFFLPATKRQWRVVRDVPPARGITGSKKTILVVDDEPANMEVTKEILEILSYNVKTACNGSEAVAIYKEQGEEIELIILDMIMPGMGGGRNIRPVEADQPRRARPALQRIQPGRPGQGHLEPRLFRVYSKTLQN